MTDRTSASAEPSPAEALDAFYNALLDDDPVALYDRAPCGYVSTLPDGTIVKVNDTFLALTGFDRSDLVGRRTFAELLSAGGRIYHETHYAPMLQMQGSAREIALDVVCADGRRLPVLVNAVLERDDEGAPVVVRAAIFDATDRREYERELVRAKDRAEASEARATALARTLQQTLIPPTPPDIPGLDVAAAYRPAGSGEEVGGDFYDVFQHGPDDWAVVVGDVCGKGVEAALVTALARHTIRAASVSSPSPSSVLATLNEVLLHSDADRFCTVVAARLRRVVGDPAAWIASVSLGGHPAPLRYRQAATATSPVGQVGSLLGVVSSVELSDEDVELASGDALVLYTDGVTEARRDGDFFGEERLVAATTRLAGSADGLVNGILEAVLQFQGGDPRDDVAVVAVRIP